METMTIKPKSQKPKILGCHRPILLSRISLKVFEADTVLDLFLLALDVDVKEKIKKHPNK
jgi:hypothetical protein